MRVVESADIFFAASWLWGMKLFPSEAPRLVFDLHLNAVRLTTIKTFTTTLLLKRSLLRDFS